MLYREFIDAGYRIFGINGVDKNGHCQCGNADCKALFKHPIAGNWQHTPGWSDDQLDFMEESGQLDTGYGVLVSGFLLVIDVDARNGGVESYIKLQDAIPEITGAGLVVNTGSGGGSQHLYFKAPAGGVAMLQHLPDYPGIDFKSTGYVVGAGSLHVRGNRYDAVLGSPSDIDDAPAAIIDLLRKPEIIRKTYDGGSIDLSYDDIADMLSAVDPDCDHETWYRCGMAVHDATNGAGFDIWNDWSKRGAKYPSKEQLDIRWHSFGKSTNPVTIATLIHYAEATGWKQPVTFSADCIAFKDILSVPIDALDTSGVDLLRPPGFVGEVVQWINSRSLYPREHLAVAAGLMAVSNCAGMRYRDPLDNSAFNLFCFGVADSTTGKESILQSHNELLRAAGVTSALVGGIKSEQEIYRNLIRHQAAFYAIDELGEHLSKIANARTRGGAVYLEGVIGTLMSIYSKSNSFVPITGDLKEEVYKGLVAERMKLQKVIDNNEDKSGKISSRIDRIDQSISTIDMGINSPFLSIFGVTTESTFNELMTFDLVANGFMGRALIFKENSLNPKIKPRERRNNNHPVPDKIKYALQQLYAPGHFDMTAGAHERVERIGKKSDLQTTDEAVKALDMAGDHYWQMAEDQVETTGMQAIPRRGYELVAKISAVLAIPSGLRTIDHVRWAHAIVKRDIEGKMNLAYSNSAPDKADALVSRVLAVLDKENGIAIGTLVNKCRNHRQEYVIAAIKHLVDHEKIVGREHQGNRGRKTIKYFLK